MFTIVYNYIITDFLYSTTLTFSSLDFLISYIFIYAFMNYGFLRNRKDLNREYTQIGMAMPGDSVSQENMFLKPIGGAVSLSHMTTPP